jgi:hypothetical protein
MAMKRRSKSAAVKTAELSLAAPQVVAHRLARMALAGPVLSARDLREFTTMVTEKQAAFAQSWLAMFTEAARQQQTLALSLSTGRIVRAPLTASGAASRVMAAGIAPVHRKAVSNAKRLARTRLR